MISALRARAGGSLNEDGRHRLDGFFDSSSFQCIEIRANKLAVHGQPLVYGGAESARRGRAIDYLGQWDDDDEKCPLRSLCFSNPRKCTAHCQIPNELQQSVRVYSISQYTRGEKPALCAYFARHSRLRCPLGSKFAKISRGTPPRQFFFVL